LSNKKGEDAMIIVGTLGNDILTGSLGDDSISGLAGNDILEGLAGNDTLNAGNGNDLLIAGEGVDLLLGGNGNDTIHLSNGANIGYGTIINGEAGIDTLKINFSNIVAYGVFNVSITPGFYNFSSGVKIFD
jgi:Ca2+-binding RTX toxin-like protein